jgi:predicted ester cyclase
MSVFRFAPRQRIGKVESAALPIGPLVERSWLAIQPHRKHAAAHHDPGGRPPDREGFKRGIRELYAAFPDFEARIEDMLVDAPRGEAVVRWTATGTHRGAFLGVAPTERRIAFKGIEILRFDGPWIVERWGEWDGLDLLAQLRSR